MTISDDLWARRSRSFGRAAARYDRYRPGYPAELFDFLLSISPGSRVLDVGSGTGRAAIGFIERGGRVTGVEHDPDMAEIAMANGRDLGLRIVVSRFEDFEGEPETFDLVTCAQAWHWIDPVAGPAVASHVLVPNGVLAVFWNRPAQMDEPVWEAIEAVYKERAPELDRRTRIKTGYTNPVPSPAAGFSDWVASTYEWFATYTASDYAGFLGTHSDHIVLPDEIREELLTGVIGAINDHGGSVDYHWRTLLFIARRHP